MTEVMPEELSHLLSLANDMRILKDDEILDELPDSVEGNPSRCIVANAFNYNCSVFPSIEGPGTIYFHSEEDALTYCKVVNRDSGRIKKTFLTSWEGSFDLMWSVPLTEELNRIARNFDKGYYRGNL